jgi:hypothetical protein
MRFSAGASHAATWRWSDRTVGTSGDVGIWPETYVVAASAPASS